MHQQSLEPTNRLALEAAEATEKVEKVDPPAASALEAAEATEKVDQLIIAVHLIGSSDDKKTKPSPPRSRQQR